MKAGPFIVGQIEDAIERARYYRQERDRFLSLARNAEQTAEAADREAERWIAGTDYVKKASP
jgi:hypothetical protein